MPTLLASFQNPDNAVKAAGGATGYLKDMGVEPDEAKHYEETIQKDGAVLSVGLPSHDVDELKAREILQKYGAVRISSSDHATV